jgi:hypothetical protein
MSALVQVASCRPALRRSIPPTTATFLSIDSSLSGVESCHDLSNGAAAEEGQCEPNVESRSRSPPSKVRVRAFGTTPRAVPLLHTGSAPATTAVEKLRSAVAARGSSGSRGSEG